MTVDKKIEIKVDLLPYNHRLQKRDCRTLDTVVLHCTELPTMALCRRFGEEIRLGDEGVGFCGHYYVDRDGAIYRYVEDDRTAYHVRGYNATSIGIEIVNNGRYPDWFDSNNQVPVQEYTPVQIEKVIDLLAYLKKSYPSLVSLARHSDLDTELIPAADNPGIMIRRKIDPGPLFPWCEVLAHWKRLNS